MSQNMNTQYLIEWMQLNGSDSHPSISSKPFIEDEELNPMVMLEFAYL